MRSYFTDYSQYGQATILHQLITDDTPPIVVDIGAHDGISGSNSRGLVERGWRGLLLEPIPSIYAQLKANSVLLPNVSVLQAACTRVTGHAPIRFGKDGPYGQMASLSHDPLIEENLGSESVDVPTITLPDLLARYSITSDFGALLLDTEGLDLEILEGLDQCSPKPRIIVTEEFVATKAAKYRFLERHNYRLVGVWGGDSFWISHSHPFDSSVFWNTIGPLPPDWQPRGMFAGPGQAHFDPKDYRFGVAAGWAFVSVTDEPNEDVVLVLRNLTSDSKHFFPCWRSFRPDVAAAFGQESLRRSGFRAFVHVPAGKYEVTVIQETAESYTSVIAGRHTQPSVGNGLIRWLRALTQSAAKPGHPA